MIDSVQANTMRRDNGRSWGVPWVLVLTAPLWLDGCVSVGISRSKRAPGPSTATLEVGVYETHEDSRRGQPTSRKIVSELVRTDVSPEQTIYRGADPIWTRSELAPGRYRVTALAAIDENGDEKALANQDSERFRLRAGDSVRATIVLKKAPVGAIVGVSAGVVALIAAAVAIATVSFFAADIELTLLPEGSTPQSPSAQPHSHEPLPNRD